MSLCLSLQCNDVVMDMMKHGNITPRVALEPKISFILGQCVLIITPPRLPDVTTLPMPTCLGGSLPGRLVQYTRPFGLVSLLMLTTTHTQAMMLYIYIHRVGSATIQSIALQDSGHGTSVINMKRNGKYRA